MTATRIDLEFKPFCVAFFTFDDRCEKQVAVESRNVDAMKAEAVAIVATDHGPNPFDWVLFGAEDTDHLAVGHYSPA